VDPTLVPGILFCSHPVESENPRLIDIGPTVLSLFGVAVPEYMDGKPLVIGDATETSGRARLGEGEAPSEPLSSVGASPSRGSDGASPSRPLADGASPSRSLAEELASHD
jgi:hypothetical protein